MKEVKIDVLLIAIVITSPIWIIPYLLYHYKKNQRGVNLRMNVLEKILEEIEEKMILVATSKEHYDQPQNGKWVEEVITIRDVENIIRSHMDEGKDTNVPSNDDWIPVEERLPEEGKEVIAQFVVRVMHINGTVDEEVYIHPLYYENGVWKSFAGVPNGRVEAWQPLPEAYHPKQAPAAEHIMSRFTRAE